MSTILILLIYLINKLLVVYGEAFVLKRKILKEILAIMRVFFANHYQVDIQVLGSGGGLGKSSELHVPFVPETQLMFYLRECVKQIMGLGYAGLFLHFDNLELLNQTSMAKTKMFFQDIRDALQIPNV